MMKDVKMAFPRSFFEMLFLVRQLYNTSTHGFSLGHLYDLHYGKGDATEEVSCVPHQSTSDKI